MDIEELTKSQLLLLMILVSFITSIATGILTVSLLDQAPPIVTQTVNRIVERTVKTVAPSLPATVVKTIISTPAPSTEDLVTSALSSQSARTVLLYGVSANAKTPALSVGAYLPKAKMIVTVLAGTPPSKTKTEFLNGASATTTFERSHNGMALYSIADTTGLPKASTPDLVLQKNLKLGETVLSVRGNGSATTGIVSHITGKGFYTTLPTLSAGTTVVDLSGNLIGISSGNKDRLFVSADAIVTLLAQKNATTTSETSATTTPAT
ncbi:MAG TPA: hypothetical protein ENI56_03010 [Candidatus Kaiserbacteria bacterium]|nr:hypothetical protein [Candidatus Kaiserbacteria bacterium]